MLETVLTTLCTFLILAGNTIAQNDIKKGQYPFTALIYFTDEALIDISGSRFLQSAVLIKLDWLVSTSLDPLILDGAPVGFPEKTLVARAGAIALDSKFTLNEDEDEQEREIVQVVRPHGHVPEKAVSTDITLLKTLLPFTSTPAVGAANMNLISTVLAKTCTVIVFNPKSSDDEKSLIEMTVAIHRSKEECGAEFKKDLMLCGTDVEENKGAVDNNNYCHGNAGGALICDGEVVGIQSYIHQMCRQPHLFHMFTGWNTFIHCGTEENCNKSSCINVCSPFNKDETKVDESVSSVPSDVKTTVSVPLSGVTTDVPPGQSLTAHSPQEFSPNATTEFNTTRKVETHFSKVQSTSSIPSTEDVNTANVASDTSSVTLRSIAGSESDASVSIPTTMSEVHTDVDRSSPQVVIKKTIIDMNDMANDTEVPDLSVRKPQVEAQKDTKGANVVISGRKKYGMNSSSVHYMNGMLILFLNLVVAY